MYLKSIEVQGFKSFANKITFKFNDGITAIVGPNGSGKSNVADAVRWVLGEQSAKQLRSSKMEDVIFSGTETRKSMGYAYVTITMDNSDQKLPIEYEEVTVTRRVYRSGESEYLLNGSICRLRDISELFFDTGIGKEGYSIIGQGQIDKILSGKPEDRRELFDEAAGIVKFKKRKDAACKNLDVERQNLVRITDILSEIEKQIGPLEQQSIAAKKYLKLYEDLKRFEVNLFVIESDKIRESKEQLEEKITIVEDSLKDSRLKYKGIKEEYEKLELLLEQYNKEIEIDKNSLNQKKITIEKNEGEIRLIKEQILGLKQQVNQNQDRIHSIEMDINSKSNEKNHYYDEKKKIDEELDTIDQEQIAFLSRIEKVKEQILIYTKQIEQYNSEIINYLNESSNIKSNLQRYETILEQNNIKKTELNRKLLQNKSEEAAIDEEIKSDKDRLQTILHEIEKSDTKIHHIEAEIISTQERIDNLTKEINHKQPIFHSERSRLESLKNLTERYEGYGNSIRKVMDLKDSTPGILGVVADIIKTDVKYETAIETALGGNIQNIVTSDEETAKKLINYLKKNKFGRATFLPLTGIHSRKNTSSSSLLSEAGVIGFADTLVETDRQYKDLINYLLGRNLVVDNIDHAIALSRKYNQSLRIVTLEGELLNPGGSMSGGAYKNTSNLISRRREIEELGSLVHNLKSELTILIREKEDEKSKKITLRNELEIIKGQHQELSLDRNTIQMNLDQIENKKQTHQDSNMEFLKEIKEIDNQMVELENNIHQLKDDIKNNESKCKDNEKKIEETNQLLSEQQTVEDELAAKQSSVRIRFTTIEQKKEYIIDNIKRIKSELEKLFLEKDDIFHTAEYAAGQITQKDSQLQELEEFINKTKEESKQLEESIVNKTKTKEKETVAHKNFFEEREILSQEINELDKEIFRLNSQLEKLSNQLEEQMNHIWEAYELTFTSALGLRDASIQSISQTKKEISEIKIKMKELGNVNLGAIEEFKNSSERYAFLTSQKEDLKKSENNLLGIINELEEGMRKQFEEKFQEIRKEFNIAFKELFGGGRATLELTSGDDLLEAGIIIISQPPGKKLQNMMQLSGGEKALTAISLLFAIQNLKPSPFCLLDEIEAALDDSNVNRFANYLHKLSNNTQFIIITHRRGTMNAADVLYGITMQEKGVSTLVAVNLIENQLDK